jgi:hypothetical protein
VSAAPGYYPDPLGGTGRRWWNGREWTDAVEAAPLPQARRWRDVRRWVPFVVAGVVLSGVMSVVSVAAQLRRLDVADAIEHRTAGFRQAAESSDHVVAVSAGIELAVLVLAAVLWLLWFARLHDDAGLMGRVRYPTWKVWGWLVPVISLFRPKQLMNDVWVASSPEGGSYSRTVSPLVHVWWALFILANVVARAGGALVGTPADTVESELAHLRAEAQGTIVSDVLWVVLSVVTVLLVLRVTARVEARGRALGLAPGGTAPPGHSARVDPPSTVTVQPVTYDAAGESTNAATRPNSAGSP